MRPKKHNFEIQTAGDTFRAVVMRLRDQDTGLPIDITNYTFRMQVRTTEGGRIIKDLSTGNGITTFDGVNGWFKIEDFITPNVAGNHVYDLEITYPNGLVETYIKGIYAIEQDVTRNE